ncbi:MAG: UDP-3-O-(3-hydroxymyristoyl)glucosamine N-acyltransferase [Acidaminococcaceae bacterium]|nr:UDP-3-O-(3-hydroxymyristoyl)glucosamine N-acyltransferase [Acidaminococcaceae bacterium]
MQKTVQEIAKLVNGSLENDNPELIITGVNGLVEAGPTEVSFAVPPYVDECHKSKAGVMLLAFDDRKLEDRPVIRVQNPRVAFAVLLELFRPQADVERTVSKYAFIHPAAQLGKNVAVQAFAYIDAGAEIGDNTVISANVFIGKNVTLGCDCFLYPNVVVRENCVLGNKVILQAGAVVGGDGFGFVTQPDGSHTKVLQTGNVIIEDDVEIGCNSTVDRATMGHTIVGKGTKIDDLVHLGHNVVVGKNCFLCAQVGVAGSTVIGDNNTFAGQVAVNGHIKIGNNNLFAGRTGITKNVGDNMQMGGFPERPLKEWMRHEAWLNKIEALSKRVKELEQRIKE